MGREMGIWFLYSSLSFHLLPILQSLLLRKSTFTNTLKWEQQLCSYLDSCIYCRVESLISKSRSFDVLGFLLRNSWNSFPKKSSRKNLWVRKITTCLPQRFKSLDSFCQCPVLIYANFCITIGDKCKLTGIETAQYSQRFFAGQNKLIMKRIIFFNSTIKIGNICS